MTNQAPRKPRRAGWLAALILVGVAAVATATLSCVSREPPAAAPPAGDIASEVHQFCGKCHAYPPPDTFPRSAWKEEVERGYFFAGTANLLMIPPPIDRVIQYYEERAPLSLPPANPERARTPLPVDLVQTRYPGPPGTSPPAVSNVNLVHLSDPKKLDLLACEMKWGQVMALKPYEARPSWQILGQLEHPAHAEVVDLDGDGFLDILVADLGSFPPTDKLCGKVVWLRGTKDGRFIPHTLLEGVGRVADVQAVDFNGDGKLDLVVAVFGWQTAGNILVLENQTDPKDWDHPRFVPHIVDKRHGAIHVPVIPRGLAGGGRPDFIALISQEHETIVAFINEGNFKFRKETIYSASHPAYGSSGIQLVDLDGDGELDVLYTNGDVLDSPHLLKPYHGVQWLRNPGKGRFPFTHHPLTPLYGVHRAVAADVDGDGKLDIVAVSYLPREHFPQRQEMGLDSVIVLRQVAPGQFARHSLETRSCDHVTCAVGDIWGTGKQDVVTANFTMQEGADAVVIWRNLGSPTSHRPPP